MPPSVAVIADQNPPSPPPQKKIDFNENLKENEKNGELAKIFGKFMKATANKTVVEEHMSLVYDRFQVNLPIIKCKKIEREIYLYGLMKEFFYSPSFP